MLRPLHLSLPLYGLLLAAAWIIPATTHAAGPPSGRDAYRSHCARCHQVDGSGVKGLYPTLRELDSRSDARAAMIAGVLQGRRGLLERDGVRVDNLMPTHGFLGNEVIAATLSYALAAWSSAGEPVSTEEVAAARLALLAGHPVGAAEAAPGSSPLEDLQTFDYVTSEGPSMTVDEFTQARRLYYGRCTGCHGVLREGTAGNPLTPELMRERGTEYLQSVISYGSSRGMPGWGTTESLSARDINLLARFLQHPVPQPPDMNLAQIRDTWHLRRITSERPDVPQHGYDLNRLFVAALHDTGEIALFDGADKQLIARVEVGRAPHRIAASASGRYLYVIGRDGTLSLVDLFAMPPIRVASVRIGYEARTIAASAGPETAAAVVLAGASWPPQLVMLDGHTLEPLRLISTRGYTRDHRYHPEARVSDLATSPAHPEFIAHIKETGQVMLVPYDTEHGMIRVHEVASLPELRAGSLSLDGRYYLAPSDLNAVSVLDLWRREVAAEIPARVLGGNAGVSYRHGRLGPVWVTSTMLDSTLLVTGTDPAGHPQQAWRVLETPALPATGSLFLATHDASPHLWVDTPLTGDARHSRAVTVFDKHDLQAGYRSLPVAEWSGLRTGPRRVLQPTYSADGREVWLTVWNPQDQASAIVVVDDVTLEPTAVIRDPGLITPTRLYNLAALVPAPQRPASPGADLFASQCAHCHGRLGEGDGVMARELSARPQDLRYLSARNDGVFPREFVEEIVDGRATRASHGPADMPVWGALLDASSVSALVDFVQQMQVER